MEKVMQLDGEMYIETFEEWMDALKENTDRDEDDNKK